MGWDRDLSDVHVDYSDSLFQTWCKCVDIRTRNQRYGWKSHKIGGEGERERERGEMKN